MHKKWLEEIADKFAGYGICTRFRTDSRCNKKSCHILRTPVYKEMFYQYCRWYKDGNKVVPKDLDFRNKNFLKNWVYGDGTLINDSTLRLCTDNFKEEEVDWLILSLNNNLDVSFKKIYMGNNNVGKPKFRPSLCIRDGLLNFYRYLGKPISCFAYKWRS